MPGKTQRSDVQRNREAVLQAAVEALTADPNASMEQIASRAGLGRATIYRHVASRPDLLQALSEQALSAARRAIAAAQPTEGAPDAALLRVLTGLAAEAGELRMLLATGVGTEPEFLAARDTVLEPVAELVQRGRDAGTFREDLDPRWATTAVATLLRAAVSEGRPDPATLVWQTLIEGWRNPT